LLLLWVNLLRIAKINNIQQFFKQLNRSFKVGISASAQENIATSTLNALRELAASLPRPCRTSETQLLKRDVARDWNAELLESINHKSGAFLLLRARVKSLNHPLPKYA
jgi:hypothetical protein